MFHHLVHRHNQEDDIDLSKHTYIGVNRVLFERHLISSANRKRYFTTVHRSSSTRENTAFKC